MTNSLLYIAVTRTPTHVGCGQGLGDIDLPLMRGKSSGQPIVPSSGVKGVLRQHAAVAWHLTANEVTVLFGPDQNNASAHAGMLAPQDARLLAMPVASLRGGWAWVSCPDALRRLRRAADRGAGWTKLPDVPGDPASDTDAGVPEGSPLRLTVGGNSLLGIGEQTFTVNNALQAAVAAWGSQLAQWAFPDALDADWRALFASRFVVVTDEAFKQLTVTATEVRARVKLDDDRVASDKALWREECLPADSLLWGLISATAVSQGVQGVVDIGEQQALDRVQPCAVQLGGKASVGYGAVDFLPLRPEQVDQHPAT